MDNMLMFLLAGVLVAALVLFAYISLAGRKPGKLDRAFYQKQWATIDAMHRQGGAAMQVAIFEADKLLDHALKASGHPGATMGDRLKGARGAFSNLDDVWQAHKLRNRLAHESGMQLNGIVAGRALRQFKAALKDLGAL